MTQCLSAQDILPESCMLHASRTNSILDPRRGRLLLIFLLVRPRLHPRSSRVPEVSFRRGINILFQTIYTTDGSTNMKYSHINTTI